jgi:mannitol-specific phosphotransferase system IIBC component
MNIRLILSVIEISPILTSEVDRQYVTSFQNSSPVSLAKKKKKERKNKNTPQKKKKKQKQKQKQKKKQNKKQKTNKKQTNKNKHLDLRNPAGNKDNKIGQHGPLDKEEVKTGVK